MLIPILKTGPSPAHGMADSPRVTFDLPSDANSVVQYLKEDDKLSHSSKLHSVIKLLISPETDNSTLLSWLHEFQDNILLLGEKNERLVHCILSLKWYVKDEKFVSTYKELILNLITAHTSYVSSVLSRITLLFLTVSIENEDLTEEEIRYLQNIHSLLKKIIEILPMSEYSLCSMLSIKFPYLKSPHCIILRYVQNLLSVYSYLPSKRINILECIIEKLIQIDVNCSKEVIEEHEAQKEESNSTMDELVGLDISVQKEQMAYPLAHTLDILMNCMFKYIHNTCFKEDGSLNWEATKKLYKELLTIFDKQILLTHGSCHVQYLLFYICSFDTKLCEGFLDYLWKKVQNPNVGPVLRQIAAFYIGSLLARAKYINISTVTACFDLICNWIHRYIDAQTSEDPGIHGTFHAVCQTIFYVFAFRNKELMDMKNGYKYLQSLNFDRMVTCRLNPLRFCDQTVIQNFASLARNHQIAYVYPIIEKNNRNLLYTLSNPSTEAVAGAMIQTLFPFDPYILKRSKHWVESYYRRYNHDQKEEEIMDHEEESHVSGDMFTYSMSPGFKKSLFLKMTH